MDMTLYDYAYGIMNENARMEALIKNKHKETSILQSSIRVLKA